MRYGILSDVHGNLEALEVVLGHLEQEAVDEYVFLGDAVGYGANPNEVCNLLRESCNWAVLGNHDAALVGKIDYSGYYESARHSIHWCKGQLSATNYEWLVELPYTQAVNELLFSHGAPVAPELFEYLVTKEDVVNMLDGVDYLPAVTFIGHSHLSVGFRVKGGTVERILDEAIACEKQAQFIITAGSVGQPRDRNPKTCCGVYDSETRVFRYYRLEYDRLTARKKIIDADLAVAFGDRLLVGI